MSNAVLEHILQILGNLVRNCNVTQTYVNKNDPLSGILYAAAFVIFSTTNRLKVYCLGQLFFGRDIILQIKHKVGWELMHQRNQTQIIGPAPSSRGT